jgi:hypothetical protein
MLKTGLDRHLPYAVWEEYALGMFTAEECMLQEEHLLVCPGCQDLLADADEYIEIAKTALTRKNDRSRRRLSKGAAAAARGSY